jgi:uncharacterized membrane protein
MKTESSVTINKPVSDCWDYFMNEENLGKWLQGYQSTETIEGEPMTVGSKHRMKFEEKGRPMEFIETVTAVEPNKEFSFQLDHKMMTAQVQVLFKEEGGKTVVTQISENQAKGFMMKLMVPLMKGSMRKRQQGQYQTFKELVEAK